MTEQQERPLAGRDHAYEAQQAAEAHLNLCDEWQTYYEDFDSGDERAQKPSEEDPSVGPYCGCQTCVVREVLAIAWPFMRDCALEERSFVVHRTDPS